MKTKSICMKDFFEMLGAPLKAYLWSWGAVRPSDGAVFLRVWKDDVRTHDGSRFVRVEKLDWRSSPAKLGRRERLEHLDLIRQGTRCYLVMCEVTDPSAKPRRVKSFNTAELFPGRRMVELNGERLIEVLPGVPAQELISSFKTH